MQAVLVLDLKVDLRSRDLCPRSNNTPTSAEYWQIERPRWTAKPFSRWPRRGKQSRDAPKRIFVRRDGCPVKIDPPAQLRSKPPEPVAFLDEADVLAYMTFPPQHRAKLHAINPIERLNGKIKRSTDVVGIFPNADAIVHLVGAILLEQNDEWAVQRARYMTLETITTLSDDPAVSLPAIAN
jgi:Transposase, Mutator family